MDFNYVKDVINNIVAAITAFTDILKNFVDSMKKKISFGKPEEE